MSKKISFSIICFTCQHQNGCQTRPGIDPNKEEITGFVCRKAANFPVFPAVSCHDYKPMPTITNETIINQILCFTCDRQNGIVILDRNTEPIYQHLSGFLCRKNKDQQNDPAIKCPDYIPLRGGIT
jgi:hypothetical protein